MDQISAQCPHCQDRVLAQRASFPHVFHLLITLLLCGLWLPVWLLLAAFDTAPFRCTRCGTRVARRGGGWSLGAVAVLVALLAIPALGLVTFTLSNVGGAAKAPATPSAKSPPRR